MINKPSNAANIPGCIFAEYAFNYNVVDDSFIPIPIGECRHEEQNTERGCELTFTLTLLRPKKSI